MPCRAIAIRSLFLSFISIVWGCGAGTDGSQVGAIARCEPKGPARPICGFQNPEDLVALPGDAAILVSEFGGMEGEKPGALTLFVLASEDRRILFRGGDASSSEPGSEPSWGDPACPGPPPPSFSPHGIHLSTREDGSLQLLVVQHGGRESIEFFEVTGSGAEYAVAWRGCVVAPDGAWLNSVAAVPEGGFIATHMKTRPVEPVPIGDDFLSGEPTGYALEWMPQAGFRILEGIACVVCNGIEVSPDGRKIFLNSTGESEVRRIDRATLETEASVFVPSPDNARWAPDGRLLVASLRADGLAEVAACADLETASCPPSFQIVAIDPESMQLVEVLYANAGPPMSAGTIGLQIGNELFVGSFGGDRILRIALDD